MRHLAGRLLHVARPLEDDLLEGARARPTRAPRTAPSRSRGSSAGTAASRGRSVAAGSSVPRAGRAGARRRRRVALLIGRTARLALLALAEGDERALEGPPALGARADRRQRSREQFVEAAHPAGDVRHERARLIGDGDLAQQTVVVTASGVDVARVDDGDAEPVQRHAGALRHPALDGDVLEVVLLEPRRRFDLDHPVAAAAALEHVRPDEHTPVPERGLVERDVAGPRERLLGLAQRLAQRRTVADQHAAAVELAGDLADTVARREAALGVGAVDLELRTMHGQPEPLAALQAGRDT